MYFSVQKWTPGFVIAGACQVRQTYWQPRPEEASYARLNALAETAERIFAKPQRCLDRKWRGVDWEWTGLKQMVANGKCKESKGSDTERSAHWQDFTDRKHPVEGKYVYFTVYYCLYIGMPSTCQFATPPLIGSPKSSEVFQNLYILASAELHRRMMSLQKQRRPLLSAKTLRHSAHKFDSHRLEHWTQTKDRCQRKQILGVDGGLVQSTMRKICYVRYKICKFSAPNETGQYSSIHISCQRRSSSKYRVQD